MSYAPFLIFKKKKTIFSIVNLFILSKTSEFSFIEIILFHNYDISYSCYSKLCIGSVNKSETKKKKHFSTVMLC